MTTNTGGPAFPTKRYNPNVMQFEHFGGMTLLDYAAIKAMQALLSDPGWRHDMDFEETASAAYRQAAKMIAAKARYA
jgi:hypothetical protein